MTDPLILVPDSVWEPTAERARVLVPLAEMSHCSKEQISEAATILGISRAMIYRLLARFRTSERTTSLLPSKPGPRPGTKQLLAGQEEVIERLIQHFYLSRQKPSVAALHREVVGECLQAGVKKPSYKAVRTRVEALDIHNATRAREGAKTANDKFRPTVGALSASEPLELVQVDHTLVDVIVVDDLYRKPIGRPWLSLAIDVATRNVLGFFLSLKRPAANAVAMTISRAVLPKTAYLAGLQVDSDWPACGLPRSLHLDNAKEFRGRALIRGCEQHGIAIIHRPPLRPHYGGHIERLIGTLMGEVQLLPGATFSSIAKRGTYDSEGQAKMTLAELEVWLAWQIAGVYHLRPHSRLRCTPLAAWQMGIAKMATLKREPADPKQFHLDFLPFERRLVGRDGLRLFNIGYWHGALSMYIGDGKKHLVKYDPNDISRVYFLERDGAYLEVPYRNLSHVVASLSEIQNGARRLRAEGASPGNEQKLFQAIRNSEKSLRRQRVKL